MVFVSFFLITTCSFHLSIFFKCLGDFSCSAKATTADDLEVTLP